MAELWPFSCWEVGWLHWEPHWTKGDPWVFIYFKKIQNWSRKSWVMAIFPLGLRDSIGNHIGQKGYPWVFICAKKIQNRSRNGWVMAIFSLRSWVIPLSTCSIVLMAVQKPIWTTLLMLPMNSLIHCSHPKLNFHGVQAEWCTSWCPWTCPWCRWLSRVHWQLPRTCFVTPDIFCFIDFVLKEFHLQKFHLQSPKKIGDTQLFPSTRKMIGDTQLFTVQIAKS